jgi:serine/threonine-protein kinase
MGSPRLRRLEGLLEAARERPAASRPSFVEAACADDPELAREVLELLASENEAAAYFGDLAGDIARAAPRELEAAVPAEQAIGPYVTIRQIGSGGMGRVFLARRADGAFDQRVALKLIRRGMESPEALRRFSAERQILARLQHPGIARFLSGGVTDEGLPWVAMEYVEGVPLEAYCERHGLGVPERLRLFVSIGEAVSFAHRQLVVHRDLKPGNILVDVSGRVRLVDFGIAKFLADEDASAHTATQAALLTPAYAAPEQRVGGPITTATDVFALGVVLHELLTGARPADSRPGAARLPEDLEAISSKARAEDAAERYVSADAMVEDVRRHLEGLPVSARPAPWHQRARRIARRHPWPVMAVGVLSLAIFAFTAASALQSLAVRRERDKAQRTTDLISEVLAVADPYRAGAEPLTAEELLERAAGRIEAAAGDDPEIEAALLQLVGRSFDKLGLAARSLPLLERALELRERTLGWAHADAVETRRRLAEVLRAAGEAERARVLLEGACEGGDDCATPWTRGLR